MEDIGDNNIYRGIGSGSIIAGAIIAGLFLSFKELIAPHYKEKDLERIISSSQESRLAKNMIEMGISQNPLPPHTRLYHFTYTNNDGEPIEVTYEDNIPNGFSPTSDTFRFQNLVTGRLCRLNYEERAWNIEKIQEGRCLEDYEYDQLNAKFKRIKNPTLPQY